MAGLLSLLQPALSLIGTPAGSPLAAFLERLAAQVDALPVPVTAVPAGQTCFVDGTNGDDTTGAEGRIDLPFQTIQAALDAASAGSVVLVWPGAVFAENLVWPQVDRIVLLGLGPDVTRVRVSNNSPALTIAPTVAGIRQGAIMGVTFEKDGGAGEVVSIDGTGFLPGFPFIDGFDLQDVIIRSTIVGAPLSVTCLCNLRARNVRATGATSSVLRELGRGLLSGCSFDSLALRYNEAGSVPPGGRFPVVLQSCRMTQVDHEGQVSVSYDAGCQVGTFNAGVGGAPIAVGASLSPSVLFEGRIETGPNIFLGPVGAAPNATVLNFDRAKLGTLGLHIDTLGPPQSYALSVRNACFFPGTSVSIDTGTDTWSVDGMASNLNPAAAVIQPGSGSTVQRDTQTTLVQLAASPQDFALGVDGDLVDVPVFTIDPTVQATALSDVASPVAAEILFGPQRVRVRGSIGAQVRLQFFGQE